MTATEEAYKRIYINVSYQIHLLRLGTTNKTLILQEETTPQKIYNDYVIPYIWEVDACYFNDKKVDMNKPIKEDGILWFEPKMEGD